MSSHSFIRQATMAAFLAAILTFTPAYSFVPSNVPHTQPSPQTSTSINIFGGLADAFKSDDSLGKATNAGLSNGPRFNDQVTVNGKAVPKAVVDQKISQVCASARVKVSYNCQNGECKTCTVKINGRKAQACVSKVPAGKCAIQTL